MFSLVAAVLLILLDIKSDKVDGEFKQEINTNERFKFRNVKGFKLQYWIICGSCVLTYSTIIPFLMVATKML
jgi:hypothetical protein